MHKYLFEVQSVKRSKYGILANNKAGSFLSVFFSGLIVDVSTYNHTNSIERMDRCVLNNFYVAKGSLILWFSFVIWT